MYKYVISLGRDCLMRSLIDRYKLREKFKIRMPFDGSIHGYEEVCRLIDTDFVDYYDNIVYSNNVFKNNKGVSWNHEKTNNIELLIVQLRKRVDQFKSILNSGENILFLIHHKNKDIEFDFKLLENALQNKYPNLKYHIFVFNNYHENYYLSKTENTTYMNIFWNPSNINNITNINYNVLNDTFMTQIFTTKYGVDICVLIFKEICLILGEDYKNYKFNSDYDFNNSLA
jgi:hypothetical protein